MSEAADKKMSEEEQEKRSRTLTKKGLINAIENKVKDLNLIDKKIEAVILSAHASLAEEETKNAVKDLRSTVDDYNLLYQELLSLYQQDREGDYAEQAKEISNRVQVVLSRAYEVIQIKYKQSDKLSEISYYSGHSRRTRSSKSSRASSIRARALADAAAAREVAEFERIRAERELEQKRREAEYARDMAILNASKQLAVANAKLKALDEHFSEEELSERQDLVPPKASEEKTREWIQKSPTPETLAESKKTQSSPPPAPQYLPVSKTITAERTLPTTTYQANVPKTPLFSNAATPQPANNVARTAVENTRHMFQQVPLTSTPFNNITADQLLETLALTNQEIVAGLARQNLPKCQPDVFSGDPTLFHPWKRAFLAMVKDARATPDLEINYLRSFTNGEVRKVVDNFRKRIQNDPIALLESLWTELERRFGSAAVITNSLLERLHNSVAFNDKDNQKLQEFSDICADVRSQMNHLPGLACLNYPNAIRPIAEKLPTSLRNKWEKTVAQFAENHGDAYPDFHRFACMIEERARAKNHPNILAGGAPTITPAAPKKTEKTPNRRTFATNATLPTEKLPKTETKHCAFHQREGHNLEECQAFAKKSLQEKTDWIRETGLCFRCFSDAHRAKNCTKRIKCETCGDTRHVSMLHKDRNQSEITREVTPKCTAVCDPANGGVSCGKVVLVDLFHNKRPEKLFRVYAIVDEQSNSSMISTELADKIGARGPAEKYFLSTCSSNRELKYGRRVEHLSLRSIDGKEFTLPTLTESEHIPQDKKEIPTPEMARKFPHLASIANKIPPLDPDTDVHILIGRDAPELLKVRAFVNGPRNAPWAQKLLLGWTISGQLCLNLNNRSVHVHARRTHLERHTVHTRIERSKHSCSPREALKSEIEYEIVPCPNHFVVKQLYSQQTQHSLANDVYHVTPEDNEASLSVEDRRFLKIMEGGIHKNCHGNWEMPLPFKSSEVRMPNNRSTALNRLNGLLRTLNRKPQMKEHYLEFMGKLFERGHAEMIPLVEPPPRDGKVWYLAHFGVYHPKKPTQIRVVFDSSAEHQGVSLNKELLAGPDMMNSLFGVLLRFRQDEVAVMCDVEQMFHSFHVNPEHRDFLRFLWFKDNDPKKEIVEYRMAVHLFGNSPSPAVATFGLRATVNHGEEDFSQDVKAFVCKNFYVDDGLASLSDADQAISLVTRTQHALATAKLRLHKIASNSAEVMTAFPQEDRAKDLRDLDLRQETPPAQRSLGVYWDLKSDTFTFRVSLPNKPFTRRGVLSAINSLYDPIGFAAPVALEGRLLLQKLVAMGKGAVSRAPLGWDDPLPENLTTRWERWRDSVDDLRAVAIPRCYHPPGFGEATRREIHAFSDASQDAIGVAIYLKSINETGGVAVSLVYGQTRVAPLQITSIPRLELCGAVLAAQAVEKVTKNIDFEIDKVAFYTDSKVVLGYISNPSRRFYVYVANRVQTIHKISEPHQWKYVQSNSNPADLATRGVQAKDLMESDWLKGPAFLQRLNELPEPEEQAELSDNDPEVRKESLVRTAIVDKKKASGLGSERFKKFSSWSSLVNAIARLISKVKEFKRKKHDKAIEPQPTPLRLSIDNLTLATKIIIKTSQQDALASDLAAVPAIEKVEGNQDKVLGRDKAMRNSRLYRLDPFKDEDEILRVGGRLRRTSLEHNEKHPVILPKDHYVSKLIARHYHEEVHHQGRQITHGAIRNAGYWLTGGHSTVAKLIGTCVVCRKLRGKMMEQRMADLPPDRAEPAPPFTNVGFDVFGPWTIQTRRTRGGAANSKRWGLVFTCLSSRAVHIEVLETLDSTSFLCALRRFLAIRGPVAILRCDHGTNFTGGKSELDEALKEMDRASLEKYLSKHNCKWMFNPPHASHFGGSWERQIGTIRRVLDAMLLELGPRQLTHELLVTLLTEVSAIVNARPIAAIPSDIDEPQPLSPSMLLTLKTRPLGPFPGDFTPTDQYARKRWRRVQYLAEQFWTRWRREHLQSLQTRKKWNEKRRNLAVGDIVMLKEEKAHRNHWPMARVAEVYASDDGQVRKVKVTVYEEGKKKTFERPVCQLVLLVPTEST